ncbi:hypothetical protein VM1G_03598 [Cytospora mali]|uniref:Uncharacterized protein n=1 Tax=Cytospora mali TaxID=578113 RepID=A0A194VTZ1_CYTMA|nr:hypothetical protein VM1G_03598 [Valsa mali]
MANSSKQRVPDHCSPKLPDETGDDYFIRWKAHRDAWRQQFLDDYYRQKETRLPSPNSEEDPDEDEMAETVSFIERCIRIENGQPEPRDLSKPVEWPQVEYPPGKSLSEIDEYEPGPFSPIPRCRPEDDEYDFGPRSCSTIPDPHPESTLVRKRSSSSPAEDGALEPPTKRRRRADKIPEISPAEPSTSGHKRKRLQDSIPELQGTFEQAQAVFKKRKTDTHNRPSLAGMMSGSKRKRESGPDEAHDDEVQASQPKRGVLGPKRRRVSEEITTNDAAGGKGCNSTMRTARKKAAVPSSPRVTRARRRQLSGIDAQLFQLGQRGQADLQGQAHERQGQATEAANDKMRPRRSSATTKIKSKGSNTTKIGAKKRVTSNTSTNTKDSVKSGAIKNTSPITNASTKVRRGRPNR